MWAKIRSYLEKTTDKTHYKSAIASGFVIGIFLLLGIFTFRAQAAVRTWDGGGADENWSTCANWSSDICPVTGDSVIFDGTSTKNSTINATAPASVIGMTVSAGYTGTITLSRTFSVNGAYSQANGTFSGTNQTFGVTTFSLTGGTFISTSGTFSVSSTFTISSGTFDANTGTVRFNGGAATLTCNSATFNIVTFSGQSGSKTVSNGCTFPLGANPTLPNIVILSGSLSGTGTLTTTGALTLNGTSSLSGFTGLAMGGNALNINDLVSDFSSFSTTFVTGAVTLSSSSISFPATATTGGITMSSGTLNASTGTLTVGGNLSLSGTATLVHNDGTILFTGSGQPIIACNNQTFNLVTITWTGFGGGTVGSDCTLPLGNNPTLTVGSTLTRTFNLSGTLAGTGTLTISGTSNSLVVTSPGTISGFTGLISGIGLTNSTDLDFSSYSTFQMAGAFAMTAGSLSLPAPTGTGINFTTFALSGGTFTSSPGTVGIGGALTISGSAVFNHNNGSIFLNSSTGQVLSCNNVVFNQVTITKGGNASVTVGSNCSLPLGNNPTVQIGTIGGSLTLNGTLSGTGTLVYITSANNSGFIISSTGVISGFTGLNVTGMTVSGATIDFANYDTVAVGSGGLALTSGSLHLSQDLSFVGDLVVSGGTFTAPTGTLTVGGDFTVTGTPTFNANGGTIIFNGSGPVIACANVTFNRVVLSHLNTASVNANCTLPLGDNPTISNATNMSGTINGTGTLTHTAGQLTIAATGGISGFSSITGTSNSLRITGATVNLGSYTNVTVPTGLTIESNGTLTAPSGTLNTIGLTISSGTFNHNNGTVNFSGASATTTCNNQSFNLVTFTGQTSLKTFAAGCALPLGSNPTIPNSVAFSGPMSGSGTLTMTTGTLTFNSGASITGFNTITGTTNGMTIAGSSLDLSALSQITVPNGITMSSGSLTLPAGITLNNAFSMNGGTLNMVNGDLGITGNFSASGGTVQAPNGTLTVGGNFSLSGSSIFNHNNGTLTLSGGGYTLACNSAIFNRVILNNTGSISAPVTCTLPLGNNPTIANSLTTSGAVTGTGTLSMTTGTLTLNSTSSLSGFSGFDGNALTLNGPSLDASSFTVFDAAGLLSISTGTLTLPSNTTLTSLTTSGTSTVNAPNGNLYISGNLTRTAGTFNHNSGTVVLNGGSQTLTGTTTFNNLTKQLTAAAAQTLTFPASLTQTVAGTLSLAGYDETSRLLLRSSTVTQWRIDPQGSRNLLYLDVKDGNNTSGIPVEMGGTGSIDSTNNTNFNFGSLTPNDPTTLGPTEVVSAVITSSTSPLFTFNLTDPNPLDTVRFQIQISQQSDFSSPVIDFDSGVGSQGSRSFTVGQLPGTGTYTVGSSGQTLSSGNYYWRVRTYDNNGLNSNYVAGNSGSMAFIIDAEPPASFTPTLNVTSPTTNVTPIISFSTTDNVAVSYYRVKVNSGSFSTRTSPYQLPTLPAGTNTITVRAYDTSDNFREEQVTLVVDLSQPATFTPTLNVTSPTSNQTPTLTFSTTDNDGIDRYEVKIDSGSFTVQTSPYLLPTLADGNHTITVRAFDTASNYRDGSVSVTVDITPPASFTPTLNVSSPTSNTQPTISFSTSDTNGVSYFQVKVDDGLYATQTSPYQVPTLSLGDHTITVKAVDTVGNERTGWVDVTIVSEVDTPPASFTPTFSPSSPTATPDPSLLFSTTDDQGIDRYEVKIDSGSFSVQTSPYQLPTLLEGSYAITVRAFDTTDQFTDGTATLIIDQTNPNSFTPVFNRTSPTNDDTPTLTFSATDSVGVTSYQVSINGGGFTTQTSPYILPSQADGVVSVVVRAFDAAGNSSEGTASLTIDTTGPDAFTPTLNVSSPTTNPAPIVSFSTTDISGIDRYEVRIDSGSYSIQSSPYQLPTLAEGSHTITVRAYDNAGNIRAGTVNVTVDLNGPDSFTPTLNVTSPTQTLNPIVSFSTTDDQGIDRYEVKVDNGSFSVQTSPYQLPSLAAGSHTITVKAYDGLGNTTDGTVSFVIDTTGPVITITAPKKISNTDITNTSLSISDPSGILISAVDGTGGVLNCTQSSATLVSCSVTISSSGDLQVEATDGAGNSSNTTETGYIIETVAPVITITAPTKVTLAAITDTTLTVTDNLGVLVSDVEAISGGSISCTQTSSTQVDCQATIRYSGNLVINVLDLAGNAQAATETGYDIDNTPPQDFTPTLNTPTETSNPAPILFFSTTDTDGMDYYLIKIDSADFSRQVSPYQLPTLDSGDHTILVRAVDLFGNFTDGEINLTIEESLPSPSPSPTPTATPEATPTPTPTPDSSPTPTPVVSPTPAASPTNPESSASPIETVTAEPESSAAASLIREPIATSSSGFETNPLLLLVSSDQSIVIGNTNVGQQLINLGQQFPTAAPLLARTVQITRLAPSIGLTALATFEVTTISLMLVGISSQLGVGALFQSNALLQVLISAGLLPIKRKHGFVHQSKTGRPIPFATITVKSTQKGGNRKLFSTLVTDVMGRYSEPVLAPGDYTFVPSHPTHNFPTRLPRPIHLTEREYYRGETIACGLNTVSASLLIPMDPVSEKQAKQKVSYQALLIVQQLGHSFQSMVYVGSVASLLSYLLDPTLLNLLVISAYVLVLVSKLYPLIQRPSIAGSITIEGNQSRLKDIAISLTTEAGMLVSLTKTDEKGHFGFSVPSGTYSVLVVAPNMILNVSKPGTQLIVNTKNKQSREMRISLKRLNPELLMPLRL